jgi:uncharacterized circularly permuted ATP-grasp superfamily protein/uncharacterized alpha-E superfamily protein
MTDTDGNPRPHWPALLDAFEQLGCPELARRGAAAERLLAAAGFVAPNAVGRTVDPVPLVLAADDWERLSAGIAQRVELLERIAADLYGERSLVRGGLLPVHAVLGSVDYLPAAHGWVPAGPRISRYAADIVRDESGQFLVMHDHTENPVGAGRALLLRSVLTRLFGVEHRSLRVQPLGPWFDTLRGALAELAPTGAASGRVAVLAPSPLHADYAEQTLLATQLGYNLVDAGDLAVHGGRLYLRAIGGMEPIGVLLRAVPDGALDPLEIIPATAVGVAGLVQAARRGRLGLSNAVGAGVVGGSRLHRFLPQLCLDLLGEELLLPSVGDADGRGTTPVLRAGELYAGTYTMCLHAVRSSDGVAVLPGGVARSTGGVKDVWVVGGPGPTQRTTPWAGALSDPVDLRDSLPCRAAEALFWLGRNAEHAENVARSVHVALSTFRVDPDLTDIEGGAWGQRVASVLALLSGAPAKDKATVVAAAVAVSVVGPARDALSDRPDGLASTLGHLVSNAAAVREFLSTSTWRLTDALLSERNRLVQPAQINGIDLLDVLDRTLSSLTSLSGLMQESVVRGPGWRFFDLGRRLERARLLVTTLRAAFSVASPMLVEGAVGEFVLASTESLVAYRRRYRTDIELDSLVDLLVVDDRNPRSLAFQLDRIREDLESLPDRPGRGAEAEVFERLTGLLSSVRADRTCESVLLAIDDLLATLVRGVTATWFAPMPVGRGVTTEAR